MSVKWSAFSAGSALSASNELVGLQSGANVRWTLTQLGTYLSTATLAAGTITTSQPLTLTQTWNDGAVTFNALLVNVTSTGSAGASTLMDLQVSSVSKFSVSKAGAGTFASDVSVGTNLFLGAASGVVWGSSRSTIWCPSNGVLRVSNDADNDFTRLQFGGTTSSFPSLKRSSATLICRLADDSANALLEALSFKTAAPSGGTSGTWKLGVAAVVSPTSPNRTIEVDIGGTIYYIAAKTTNN